MAQRRAPARREMEGPSSTPSTQAQAVVPFCQGSKPETELCQVLGPYTLSAVAQPLPPIIIPANGYLRNIWIELEGTAAFVAESAETDRPWSILEKVRLTEPNGAPIGAELSGYNLFLANVLGRYAGASDPRLVAQLAAGKNLGEAMSVGRIALRVPLELAPNGLGSLGNQSASAAFRLYLTLAPKVAAETTAATLTVRVLSELWGEPPERDILGRPVQQAPPFEGTAQYWSEYTRNTLNVGNNQTRITRVGSMIRNLILVYRTAAGARVADPALGETGVVPPLLQLQWDNRVFRTSTPFYNNVSMSERINDLLTRGVSLQGVYWYNFSQGEHRMAGENEINSWLPTLTSTRLEHIGSSSTAGLLDYLVNDVSVTAVNPLERTQQIGVGGYHPPIGESSVGAA